MNNTRNQPGTNAQYLLFNQVNGICPLCAEPLLYCKDSSSQYRKNYELDHIYPLNPTAEEVELLKDEPKLSPDVNSLDNFIPLCPKCHNRFDNPRTVSEYRILYSLKQRLIAEERSKNMFYQYTIAEEIQKIVLALTQSDLSNSLEPLDLTALRIEQKLEKDFSPITKRHIISDVTDFYPFIRGLFMETERNTPGKFDLIATNVHAFYLQLKISLNKQETIYDEMAKWIQSKTPNSSLDACKVVVAFFIQNCEVFENVTQ